MTCRNAGSTGSSSVAGSSRRTSASRGTRDSPVADGELLGLPQALQLGLCPVDLQRRDQARVPAPW